jgi:anti-sigma regulatory factor (Ser/Thr protein kinase)
VSCGGLGHGPALGDRHYSVDCGAAERAGLVHAALLYRGTDEYLDGILGFVRHGVAVGEPVLVAVPGQRVELVRAGLGPIAGQVRFVDMTDLGRNPGRIIPGLLCGFVDEHRTGRVRVVGEPVRVGRSAVEYPACVQHEALINLALADRPVTILCPYDAGRLDPAVLTDAASTHPILVEHAEWRASPSFADPAEVVDAWNRPLPEPSEVPTTLVFAAPHGPRQVRRVAHEVATRAGLTDPRLTDLLLAVHEVAVNTALHTGRPGLFSIWCDGGQVVCQVQDSGHITDRLAGRRCPAPHDIGGHGLRLVNQLCDLVRIHTRRGETTVRLHMRLAPDNDAGDDASPDAGPGLEAACHLRPGAAGAAAPARRRGASSGTAPPPIASENVAVEGAPVEARSRHGQDTGASVVAAVRGQAAYAQDAAM